MGAFDAIEPSARRTLLKVLVCVAQADGDISAEEQAALRGASIALGAADEPISSTLTGLELEQLSSRDAMLVYCAAAWMALADGIRWRDESRFLAQLERLLRLDPDTARFLNAHARWVRTSTELPWHREFDALICQAAQRLTRLEAAAA